MTPRTISALLAIGCLAVSGPAFGQPAKAQEAKTLEKEADAAFEAGQWNDALEKYDRLSELQPQRVPHKLRAARCVERLGRLIEAEERFGAIVEAPPLPKETKADAEAIAAAKKSRASLEERIPRAVIVLEGTGNRLLPVDVKLDGQPFPSVKIGIKHPVDPGEHKVEGVLDRGREGKERTSTAFTIKEGETQEVPLRFGSKAEAKPAQGKPEGDDYWSILKRGRSTQRTVGWIMVGVGGAVFLGGGATTLVALGVKSSLDDQCPGRHCPPSAYGELDTYDTLQTLTTIFYVAGAAGVATGIALLATAPSGRSSGGLPRRSRVARDDSSVHVSPWVGAGSAGLVGSF